jgi:hypothetical protein
MSNQIVGIWAPLRYTNYGDDLQAIVFALFVKSLGYKVRVYQLDEGMAKIYKLDVAHNLNELCNGVKLCIIAGGALLTPRLLHRRLLHKGAYEYEQDFKNLFKACEQYKTKFLPISIGGDGKVRNPALYIGKHRSKFFKSKHFMNGTVRLVGDVEQMEKFGKSFEYYPDYLLQTPKYLPLNIFNDSKTEAVKKIGLNLKRGRYLSKELLNGIYNYAEQNDDMEFYFIKTHTEHSNINYEYTPQTESKNIKIVMYTSPSQLLEFIQTIDVLITSKLHLGITGLSIGTPYLSYRGHGKAKTFTMAAGVKECILEDDISFNSLKNKYLSKTKHELMSMYNNALLDSMINESGMHYVKVEETLKTIYNEK